MHFKYAGNAISLGFGGVAPKDALQQPTYISFCNNLHFSFAKNIVMVLEVRYIHNIRFAFVNICSCFFILSSFFNFVKSKFFTLYKNKR